MIGRFVLSPPAARDIDEIWEYIAAYDIDAADRVADKFFAAFGRLADMPGLGHRRADLMAAPVKFWTVAPYLIVYDAAAPILEIIRVLHGSRDVAEILSG